MSVQHDPVYGREVLARFTDGTELSICGTATQSVEARYCREDMPEQPIFVRREFLFLPLRTKPISEVLRRFALPSKRFALLDRGLASAGASHPMIEESLG
jgi:hypothetical protein